jgi:hypothetical protein
LPLPDELFAGTSCLPCMLTVNFCCAAAVIEKIIADKMIVSVKKNFLCISIGTP